MTDDELTSVMSSRMVTGSIRPAAGRAPAPPPSRASVRPPGSVPPPSSRIVYEEDAEDDGILTSLRGAPRIVKRRGAAGSLPPLSQTGRVDVRRNLIPGPPSDLLEERVEAPRTPRTSARPSVRPGPDVRLGHSRIDDAVVSSSTPIAVRSSPASSYPAHYGVAPSAPAVVAPQSLPAHFMTPHVPVSDPPATSVTASHRIPGRPAMSWAAVLVAFGLFVGVSSAALLQSGDAIADTTASFVDPSRAPARAAENPPSARETAPSANPEALPAPAPTAKTLPTPAVAASTVAPPAVAAPTVTATPTSSPVAAVTARTQSPAGVAFAPVAIAPVKTAAPPPPPPRATWKAPAPAPTPIAAAPKVASKAPWDDDAPKVEKKKPIKSRGGEADDETKKALEALQRAQLESSSSFGKE